MSTDTALPRARSVGELREGLVQMMDLEAWPGVTVHESKEVLLRTPEGDYLLDNVGWSFVQGRFVVVLEGAERDPRR